MAMNGSILGKRLFHIIRDNHISAQLNGTNLKEIVDQLEKEYECTWHMKNGVFMKTVTKHKPEMRKRNH
jgi:hypothetical protein